MKDTDTLTFEEASRTVQDIDIRYRLLDHPDDQEDLAPARDAAWDSYSKARLNLLKPGVITTDEDLAKMEDLHNQVKAAAETQDLIVAAIRVAAFLARLAIRA